MISSKGDSPRIYHVEISSSSLESRQIKKGDQQKIYKLSSSNTTKKTQ